MYVRFMLRCICHCIEVYSKFPKMDAEIPASSFRASVIDTANTIRNENCNDVGDDH